MTRVVSCKSRFCVSSYYKNKNEINGVQDLSAFDIIIVQSKRMKKKTIVRRQEVFFYDNHVTFRHIRYVNVHHKRSDFFLLFIWLVCVIVSIHFSQF